MTDNKKPLPGFSFLYAAKIVLQIALYISAMHLYPVFGCCLGILVVKEALVLLMRIRHKRVTGAGCGILWHDYASIIVQFMSALLALVLPTPSRECIFLLMLNASGIQLISLGAYMNHFYKHRKEDPNPRMRMTAIDKQVMVMLLLLVLSTFILPFSKTDPYMRDVLWHPAYVFVRFASIVGTLGIPAFFLGEMLPRERFDPEKFPYRCYKWEKDGKFYEKVGIQLWKTYAPDMSKYMSKAFPKQGHLMRDPDHLHRLVLETCSAELVHWVLILISPLFLLLMDELGALSMILYIIGNLASIAIQRYNRPRIMMLWKRMEKRRCANS